MANKLYHVLQKRFIWIPGLTYFTEQAPITIYIGSDYSQAIESYWKSKEQDKESATKTITVIKEAIQTDNIVDMEWKELK